MEKAQGFQMREVKRGIAVARGKVVEIGQTQSPFLFLRVIAQKSKKVVKVLRKNLKFNLDKNAKLSTKMKLLKSRLVKI